MKKILFCYFCVKNSTIYGFVCPHGGQAWGTELANLNTFPWQLVQVHKLVAIVFILPVKPTFLASI